MPDECRRPTQAHASAGSSPTSTSGLYTQQARLNGMHGRRVPVDPPQPVVVDSVWGPAHGWLYAWRFDRARGWMAEVIVTVLAASVKPDRRPSADLT